MESDLATSENATAIDADGISKSYGSPESVTAVDGVSLTVERGSVVGILGPNGAGKTTLIKCILGTVVPDEGTVEVLGDDSRTLGRATYRRVSAMLEGARNIYWRMSLRENVRYFTGLQGIDPDSVQQENVELVSRLGMSEKLDEPVRNFSRGQKQRASLACVLAQRTPITFLDEPTLGLDLEAARSLRRELSDIADGDRTVVLSSHDMDVVEQLCDRVVILENGSVVADERVEELIDLFKTQSYEIRVSGEVTAGVKRALREEFGALSWEGRDLSVTITEAARLYALMNRLQDAGLVVDSIESSDPDLEEAFLRITDEGETESTAVTGAQ